MKRLPYITKTSVGFFVLVIVLLLSLVVYFKMVYPIGGDIALTENKLHTEQQLIATYQSEKNKTTKENSDAASERKLPRQASIDELLVFLNGAEASSGAHINDISFDTDAGVKTSANLPAGLEPIHATLSVTAPDYEKMTNFLDKLETAPRRIVLNNLSFSSSGGQKGFSFTVKINTFYFNGNK